MGLSLGATTVGLSPRLRLDLARPPPMTSRPVGTAGAAGGRTSLSFAARPDDDVADVDSIRLLETQFGGYNIIECADAVIELSAGAVYITRMLLKQL